MKKYILLIAAFVLGSLLCAITAAQPGVQGTAGPIVVDAQNDLASLDLSDNQVVILANSSGGTLLVYDKDATDTVNNSTVYNGPNSIGRFKTFLAATATNGIPTACDQVVIGTANAATDDAAIDTALAVLNAQGYGTLYIDKQVYVASPHEFNGAISLKGMSTEAVIHVTDAQAGFFWGPAETYTFDVAQTGAITGSAVPAVLPATSAMASYIFSPNLELEEGDWFVVWSEDELSGMFKNATYQKPAELHTVFRRDSATVTADAGTDLFTETISSGKATTTYGDIHNGWPVRFSSTGAVPSPLVAGTTYYAVNYNGAKSWKVSATSGGAAIDLTDAGSGTITVETDAYVLGNFIVDALTSSPKIRRIPMWAAPGSNNTSHVYVGDFRVSQAADVHDNLLWQFCFLNGLKVSNIHYELNNGIGAPGYFSFNYCSNVVVDHLVCDGVDDYDTYTGGSTSGSLYLVQCQLVNGMVVSNCNFRRSRHAVDMSNGFQSADGNTRYGTPRGVLVTGNNFFHESHADGALPPVSSHGEGWGVVISNNTFHLGSTFHSTYAAILRSRNMSFVNNTVHGDSITKGLLIEANDATVANNHFYGCWRAAEIDYTADGFDRCRYVGNTHNNCGGAGSSDAVLIVKDGDDHMVLNNVFDTSLGACIRVTTPTGGGVGGVIANNTFTNMSAAGSQACIKFSGTAAVSAENWRIVRNLFDGIPETCIEFAGGASGVGDGQQIIQNTFIGCTGTSLIVFADDGSTSGHRIAGNDVGKGANTNFVNVGALDAAAVTFVGNNADGYGAGSLGLTGTNAAAITAAQAASNWTD